MQHTDEEKKSGEDILSVALERFKVASEAETDVRTLALDDLKFSAGEQWPDGIKRERELEGRPCLTINRLPQFIRQITNDQRQNRPSIKVSPIDDHADIETGKIYQGIIRHIEYSSDADVAYDTAFEHAVRTGFGYFRIVTDYCDPHSFDQDIRIKPIKNQFSVFMDPAYRLPDGSDANWAFIVEDYSPDNFKAQFPESKLAKAHDWDAMGLGAPEWITENGCRVAEYFYKEWKDTTIYLFVNQETGEKISLLEDDLPEGLSPEQAVEQAIDSRKTRVPVIHWVKTNGVEILEETVWPGRWIPIIPVLGEELEIEGKRILSGVVRYAKDPQRMYNFWASAETETIALAPRAPFIGIEGQFEGHKDMWELANRKNLAYLQYKPITLNGQVIATPPQRNVYEPPVQAISQARMLSSEDLKATTGIYDAAMGAQSNETSGVAIQRRNIQAQTSNFHFMDNLSRSIKHCGRQVVDLIPKIYDTDRTIRILGEDGNEEIVRINQEFERNGQSVRYELGVGKYDVAVDTGPSFETKRQEAVEAMLEFTRAMPQHAGIIADLLVANMDWPKAKEISDRLKKTLPPEFQDDKGKQQMPPEAQAQMQQMNQLIEQLTQQLNQAQDKLDNKLIEIESKERIAMQELQVKLQIEQAKLQIEMAKIDSQDSRALFQAEIAQLEGRLNMLGQNEEFPTQDQMPAGQDEMAATGEMQPPQPTGGLPPGNNYME